VRLERALASGATPQDLAERMPGRIPRPPREYREPTTGEESRWLTRSSLTRERARLAPSCRCTSG
jgi:hypothetical protein